VFVPLYWAGDVLAGFARGAAWPTLCVLGVVLGRRGPRRALV